MFLRRPEAREDAQVRRLRIEETLLAGSNWKYRQLDEFTAQINTYEALLRDLYPRLEASLAQHVDQTLGRQLVRVRSKLTNGFSHTLPISS
jgi:hypothetical protein